MLNFGFRFVPPAPVPFPIVAAGDPATKAARVSSAEVGYTAELSPSIGFDLTGFYTRTSRAIAFPGISSPPTRTPPAVPFVLFAVRNAGSVETYGVEASVRGQAGPAIRWQVNYTLVETDEAIRGNRGDVYRQPLAFEAQTPRHTINGQLSYEHGPLLASVQGRYTSRVSQLVDESRAFVLRPVRDALAIGGRVRLALTPNVAATVLGSNITDAASATGAAVGGERRVRAGLSITL